MASKAIITGVIINATAFVGGSYLAKYLSGDQNRVEEKKRQDLAVENYQAAYEKHQEIEQNSLIGLQLMTESRSSIFQDQHLMCNPNLLPKEIATARSQKVYKYALTVVDVASRFKAVEPLTSKDSSEVSRAFHTI
ncbi:hypothetical protein pdam_00018014 [Pocillopora damicornis]|uniref:Uncharacterized protein n=1 Tax=Pocillopora damicornis TaxID=46731 RepID=A0A3M6TF32_POCDA|nr:hypothetical protein pdam_00018014 [Pocillopora damicornis]